MSGNPGLADGTYDVFVVDAEPLPGGEVPVWRLELAVVAGAHRGEVVTVQATGLVGEEADLLGLPGTLTVTDGEPAFHVER